MQQNLSVKQNVSLKKYHTYGINATARFLVEVTSILTLKEALQYTKEHSLSYILIGKGSNILFRDNYFNGLVIVNKMKDIQIEGERVIAGSGVNMSRLARETAKLKLSGFEPLVGIPGSVGGCIWMNAGANLTEISKYLVNLDVLEESGLIKTLTKEECGFCYRYSKFHENNEIILQATFQLEKKADAPFELEKHWKHRFQTQPVDKKNSGCIFKV